MKKIIQFVDSYQPNTLIASTSSEINEKLKDHVKNPEERYSWEIEHLAQSSVFNPTDGRIYVTTTIIANALWDNTTLV